MIGKKHTVLAISSLSLLLMTTLGGCGQTSSDQVDASILTRDQIELEYGETVASYPYGLPDGVAFPAELYDDSVEGVDFLYKAGWGAMQAYFFAECAYEGIALADPVGDPQGTAAALDEVDRIHQAPVYQQHFDDSSGSWQGIMDKARLGDFSMMR